MTAVQWALVLDQEIAEQRRLIWWLRALRLAECLIIVWTGWCMGWQVHLHHWSWTAFLVGMIAANVYLLNQNRRIVARCQDQIVRLQRWGVPA